MKITKDLAKFDSKQIELLRWIAATVKESLEKAKIPTEKSRELTENLTFQIACVIDGSTVMGFQGERLIPMLTFAADETVEELVIAEEPGSWMHEYAIGTAEEISDGIWKARSPE